MTTTSAPGPTSPAASQPDLAALLSTLANAPSRIPLAQQIVPRLADAVTDLILKQGYHYRAIARLLQQAGLKVTPRQLELLHLKSVERRDRRKIRAKLENGKKTLKAGSDTKVAGTVNTQTGNTVQSAEPNEVPPRLVNFVRVQGNFGDASMKEMKALGFKYVSSPRGFAPITGRPVEATSELAACVARMKATVDYALA
ncbi:hypothetical protein [Falsiroseomonas sp. E2-1-a4]|uniref:hypothetical protein n=1 Tax=Falsiroseomonas sp. E2-1-a4 TaxID=3239299 RepID=UPI003F2D08C8